MKNDINYYISAINKDQTHDKQGGNSVCYVFNDVVLLYGSIDISNIDRKIRAINDMKEKGINVVQILDYKVDDSKPINTYSNIQYQKGWTLQERAKGAELHSAHSSVEIMSEEQILNGYLEYKELITDYYKRIKRLSEATQEQVNKFVSDYAILEQSSLMIDPSKAGNFFYDTEKGFSFIDMNEKNPSSQKMAFLMEHILLVTIPSASTMYIHDKCNTYKNGQSLTIVPEEICRQLKCSVSQLLEKLVIAFKKFGFSTEQLNLALDKRLPEISNVLDNAGYSDDQAVEYIMNTLEQVKEANSVSAQKSDDDWSLAW